MEASTASTESKASSKKSVIPYERWLKFLSKPLVNGGGTSWMHRGPSISKPRGTREGDRQAVLSDCYREFYLRTPFAKPFKSVDELEDFFADSLDRPADDPDIHYKITTFFITFAYKLMRLKRAGSHRSKAPHGASTGSPPDPSQLPSEHDHPKGPDPALIRGRFSEPTPVSSTLTNPRGEGVEGGTRPWEGLPPPLAFSIDWDEMLGVRRKPTYSDAIEVAADSNLASQGTKRKWGAKSPAGGSLSKRPSAFSSRASGLSSSMRKASENLLSAEQDNKQWLTLRRHGEGSLRGSPAIRDGVRKEIEQEQRERLVQEQLTRKIYEDVEAKMMAGLEHLKERMDEEIQQVRREEEQKWEGFRSKARAEVLEELRKEALGTFIKERVQSETSRAQAGKPNVPTNESIADAGQSSMQSNASDSAFGSNKTSGISSPDVLERRRPESSDVGLVPGSGDEQKKRVHGAPTAGPIRSTTDGFRRWGPNNADGVDPRRAGPAAGIAADIDAAAMHVQSQYHDDGGERGLDDSRRGGMKSPIFAADAKGTEGVNSDGACRSHGVDVPISNSTQHEEGAAHAPVIQPDFDASQRVIAESQINFEAEAREPDDFYRNNGIANPGGNTTQQEEDLIQAPAFQPEFDSSQAVIAETQIVVEDSQSHVGDASGLAETLRIRYTQLQHTATAASNLVWSQDTDEELFGQQNDIEDAEVPDDRHGHPLPDEEQEGDEQVEGGEYDDQGEFETEEYDEDDGEDDIMGSEDYNATSYPGSGVDQGYDDEFLGYDGVVHRNDGIIKPSTSNEVIDLCDSDDEEEADGAIEPSRVDQTPILGRTQSAGGNRYVAEEYPSSTQARDQAKDDEDEDEEDDEDEDLEEDEGEEEGDSDRTDDRDTEDRFWEPGTPAGDPPSNPLNIESRSQDSKITE
ncbi:MAG: hypothetical protein M1815_003700 [Lichina confinis]|nr:MAG: hypothetical protein M1815_003700 [Lichina confinis]